MPPVIANGSDFEPGATYHVLPATLNAIGVTALAVPPVVGPTNARNHGAMRAKAYAVSTCSQTSAMQPPSRRYKKWYWFR